ncbi:MAG: HlyD family type I secretion periplasmic adaptor subunit [Pseudomonadota bacterium]
MFGDDTDSSFANNIAAAGAGTRGTSFWPILIVLMITIGLFVGWASFAEIEEVTSGEGKVIPSGQIQVVQTLEGGIVSSISVSEGELVEKGQVLIQIDDTSFSSQLGELEQRQAALKIERLRLNAEANQQDEFVVDADVMKLYEASVRAEAAVFASRRKQLLNELEVLENRLEQRNFEFQEATALETKIRTALEPLQKEAELTRRMVSRGVVPEIELLRLESRLAELAGDFEVAKSSKPRLQASIREAENLKQTTRNNYVNNARERLAKLEAELSVIQETIRAATDRVTRAQLRAPVKGIVNKINVATIGAVVQPGKDIMQIVPVDDGLMIEARIRPQDVAFLKPNEEASVKLTAYDYLIYGDLRGQVVRISADTIESTEGEEFYQVIVRTDKNHLGETEDRFPIIPGMIATVDIKTGKNTVLSYLMKPILRAQKESLRER